MLDNESATTVSRYKIQDRQFSHALKYPVYYLKVIIKLLFIFNKILEKTFSAWSLVYFWRF